MQPPSSCGALFEGCQCLPTAAVGSTAVHHFMTTRCVCVWCVGVLDLMSQTVSHVYCPPPQEESLTGWSGGHHGGSGLPKQPCWTSSGTSYCHGHGAGTGLSIVDFHPSLHSPCHVGEVLVCHTAQLCRLSHGTVHLVAKECIWIRIWYHRCPDQRFV